MSSTLLTAAIVLAALFIFIVLFVLLHKKAHNKKLTKRNAIFADIVSKNKLKIEEQESINNCLIAIDKINFVLLYIDFGLPKEEVALIDLWQIRTVKVGAEENAVYEFRKGKNVLIDKQVTNLHLEVAFEQTDKPKLQLPLHQYKDGMQDFVHIKQRANHWCKIINSCVKDLTRAARQA